MTPFGQRLAEFEMWTAQHEPRLSPAVSQIINDTYRSKGFSGLGDAVSDLLNSDPSITGGVTSSAASDTSNALTSLFAAAGSLVNNQAQSQARLQQLQLATQQQQAVAAGAASNNNTILLVAGAIAVLAALSLSRR